MLPLPRDCAHPTANNYVVAYCVVHLVSSLNIQANTARVPHNVVVHQGLVGAVDCDPDLFRLEDGVAHKRALLADLASVEMKTILSHNVALTAILHTSIPNVHYPTMADHRRVDPLVSDADVLMVSCDDNRTLHVDNLRRQLEAAASDLLVSAHVVMG